MMSRESIKSFTLHYSDETLADLQTRLSLSRLPRALPSNEDGHLGVPVAKLQKLLDTWQTEYDWRRCESFLNSWPQFTTHIDGIDLYFLHIKSPRRNALPILLVHGWPGSILEFRHVIPSLTDPKDDSYRPFDLIIPALPGYTPSSPPPTKGYTVPRIATIYITLMQRLGYPHWAAQGGDWGSNIVAQIGHKAPPGLVGVHINTAAFQPAREIRDGKPTPEEAAATEAMDRFFEKDEGYGTIQRNRPQTLSAALADSPLGQAAWIYEKLHSWSTPDAARYAPFDMHEILDNIMLYWLGNTSATASMLYHEWDNDHVGRRIPAHIVVGMSLFPHDTDKAPRTWAERHYENLVHFRVVETGGHFAAWEVPDIFVREVQDTFRHVSLP